MSETTGRGLTIHRPWTTLILSGAKTVENRSWHAGYRGWVLIHGGKQFDAQALAYAADRGARISRQPANHPQGVVGIAKLASVCSVTVDSDVDECDCGVWAVPGQYHWRLASPRALATPVACVGRQGLWVARPEVVNAVRVQVAGGAR